MTIYRNLLAVMLLSALPLAAAETQGTIVRQATVYSDASSLSQTLGRLKAGSVVGMYERKGGWQEVFSEKRSISGWVRTYQVRAGDFGSTVVVEEQEDSRGFLAGLAAFSRSASGFFTQDSSATSSSTATIGVRGLSETEIKSAKVDMRELKRMQKFSSNRKRMKAFRSEGNLKAKKVPFLPGAEE